jgi:hypothetical protein
MGLYSQHFFFFITNKLGQQVGVFDFENFCSLMLCNTIGYWEHPQVTKKIKCCEYGPGTPSCRFSNIVRCRIVFHTMTCISLGGSLSTVDHLIKLACFVKDVSSILNIKKS